MLNAVTRLQVLGSCSALMMLRLLRLLVAGLSCMASLAVTASVDQLLYVLAKC